MQRLFRASSILAILMISGPAWASRHPVERAPTFVDVAAQPAYPIEIIAPLRKGWRWHHSRHSSVHALRRSRSRRMHTARHVDRKPPRRAEEAHKRPAVRVRAALVPNAIPTENALSLAAGALVGLAQGFEDGIATAMPDLAIAHAPRRLVGILQIGAIRVRFGSGGAGYSLDYGDYLITPDDVGSWGARHGAIGIAHDTGCTIHDARLGRDRCGIEMHAATNGELITEGCVAIARRQWQAVKKAVLAMIEQSGRAFLRIDPSGARIEPDADPVIVLASAEKVEEHHTEQHHHRHWRRRHLASR